MAEQSDMMIAGRPAYEYGSRKEAMDAHIRRRMANRSQYEEMTMKDSTLREDAISEFNPMWAKFQASEARRKSRLSAQKAAMRGRGAAVQRRAFFEEDQGDMGMTTGG